MQRKEITDFSTQVLPEFIGQIATWENTKIHRDIGTLNSLIEAHSDPRVETTWSDDKQWQKHTLVYREDSSHVVK